MKIIRTRWHPCFRIISSRFPPVGWFDTIASPEDLQVAYELEALTNPLIRDQVGDLRLVPDDERISGPGTQLIMTAFTQLSRVGGRFGEGTSGVYYAGDTLETAVQETIYHHTIRLLEVNLAPLDLELQVVLADLDGKMWDVRGPEFDRLHNPDPATYGRGQEMARQAKAERVDGIRYRSVRNPSGECVAVLRPRVLSSARSAQHLIYPWDGVRIDPARVCVKTLL